MIDDTLERDIERPAHQFAISRGWYAEKIMRTVRRGFPDHLFVRDGLVIFIEFKRPGEEAMPQQQRRHAELREHGASVFVIDNLDEAKRVLY